MFSSSFFLFSRFFLFSFNSELKKEKEKKDAKRRRFRGSNGSH